MRLSELLPGMEGRVETIDCGEPLEGRLRDLGLGPGTAVRCLHRAPGGSPAAYRIRGAAIALRREDAEKITLERPEP